MEAGPAAKNRGVGQFGYGKSLIFGSVLAFADFVLRVYLRQLTGK